MLWGAFRMGRGHQRRPSLSNRRYSPGKRLRALRLVLGLTLRDVQKASVNLSKRLKNSAFLLPPSRLHEFETRNVIPSIHRLYTLARVYGYEITKFLDWYGIPRHTHANVRTDR